MLERGGRGNVQVVRSQLTLELGLTAYAVVAVAIVFRVILLLLDVNHRIWIGATIYGFTDPIVQPLRLLPGADRQILGPLTLPDVTLVAFLLLVPLGIMARRDRRTFSQ